MKDQSSEWNDRKEPVGQPGQGSAAASPQSGEHPFYGNQFTNLSSADVPEMPDAIRSLGSKASRSGPQLLDDDCYFS